MFDRIKLDPKICHGKPVIKGTRVLVSSILGAMASGDDIATVLEDYPNISSKDILQALKFASDLSQFEDIPYESFA